MTLQHNNNPDHPIAIRPSGSRIKIELAGEVIADTTDALALEETTYPVAYYIPRRDVRMAHLEGSAKATHCPYKGDARYWSVSANGQSVENGVWSYEEPMDAVSSIEGYLAFYPDRFDISIEPAG